MRKLAQVTLLVAALLGALWATSPPTLVATAQFGFGTGTMPKKSTDPTCSSSHQGKIYYNTTNDEFLGCDGSTWRTLGSTSSVGQLEIANGTVGDPSIVFTSDDDGTGTGIYRAGTDILSFTANGVNMFDVGPTIEIDFSATSPTIQFANNGTLSFFDDGSGAAVFAIQDAGAVADGIVNTRADTLNSGSHFSAGRGSDFVAQDGSDIAAFFRVDAFTDANHTSTGNEIIAFEAEGITSKDADSDHIGLKIDSTWDIAIDMGNLALTEAELEAIDGVTLGTATASKYLSLDSTSQLGGMGILRHTVTSLTNVEINALAATPIVVVAAPGANLTTIVVGWRFFLDFVATGFDDAAADGNIVLEYAPGTQIGAAMEADALVDATADFSSYTMVSETGPVSTATPSNNAIEIANDGAEFTDTGGDAIAEVEVWYFIVDSNPTQ